MKKEHGHLTLVPKTMCNEEDPQLAGLFGQTSLRPEILSSAEFKKAVAFGALQAECLVKKILRGERIKLLTNDKPNDEKIGFNELLIRELNARIEYYHPGIAGKYRIDDDVRLGGLVPSKARDLKDLMYMYGVWLEGETKSIGTGSQDLLKALEVASGAHYGLVHILHPFEGGNGRTGRALLNGVLLIGAAETRLGQEVRYPVPLLRTHEIDEVKMAADLEVGKEVKMDPYIKALMEVENTGDLGPFELHLANAWVSDLKERGVKLGRGSALRRHRSRTDDFWLGVVDSRIDILEGFIERQVAGRNEPHLIPDFFTSRHIRVA